MKALGILTLFIALTGFYGYSQEDEPMDHPRKEHEKKSPEEKANHRTDKMTEVLGLSPDQEEKIRAINLAHAVEMEKIHEEMKALKKRAKEAKEKTKSEIDEVLNDDQKAKLEAEKEKHKEERERKKKERCCQGNE